MKIQNLPNPVNTPYLIKALLVILVMFALSRKSHAQSPGGVTGATVWFKANAGTTLSGSNVTAWSNNGSAAVLTNVTGAAGSQPTLTANAINFDPAITFSTSTAQGLMQNTSFAKTNLIALKNYSYFSVVKRSSAAVNGVVIWHHGSSATADKFGIEASNTFYQQFTNNTAAPSSSTTITAGIPYLQDVVYTGGASNGPLNYGLNGNNFSTVTVANSVATTAKYSIGVDQNQPTSWNWQGDIAELITYNTSLSAINIAQVRSYLSLKYGITLSNNANNNGTVNEVISGSVREGDYVLGDGTTRVWNYGTSSSYNQNIAGIVSDATSSGLIQKQSQSVNAGTHVVVGLGNIAATNAANSNNFAADKSALVWGDNGSSTTIATPVTGSAFSNFRMSRVWQVQETGTVGTVTVAIPSSVFTGNNKVMIVSASAAFASGNTFIASTGTQTINGVAYETFPFDFTTAQYFTFGTYVPVISGSVYNDVNGTSNNLIDGTLISTAGGQQLYANLINHSTGLVVGNKIISGGTYTLDVTNGVAINTNFDVVISTVQGVNGTTTGAASILPGGWMNTAEGSGAGDGTTNGLVAANVVTSDISSGADFGITQAGYIYVHKKTSDESSSTDFTFTGTGGITSITLNDNPTNLTLKDIGSSQNGRLWAVANATTTLYYRDLGTVAWTATSITNASRVDGGAGNTCYIITTTGSVVYFDGVTSTTIGAAANYGSSNAADIGSVWDNQPYITTAAGAIWRYSGTGTTWVQIGATTNNLLIDGNPATGNILVSKSDNNVYDITGAGVQTNLGKPGTATASVAGDIAVDASGNVYATYTSTSSNNKYVFKWSTGTTWSVREETSRNSSGLTGGIGGQVWMLMGFTGSSYFGNIFSRSFDGTNIWWLDDERVRTSPANGNSQMIAVVPGTYTITENVPVNWDLQGVQIFDPTSNSSSNVVANAATLTVAAGETVHTIFVNGAVNSFATSCATNYLENFGTGAVGTYGPALTGQTNYHYMNTNTNTFEGYYKVHGNANVLFGGAANLNDHTSGDGMGRMMIVDAGYDLNDFFRRRFTGLIAGATYTFSAWLANINTGGAIKPNVAFKAIDPTNYNPVASISTGNIIVPGWNQYTLTFTATATSVDLLLSNNALGGSGNDLAIDDITLTLLPLAPVTTTVTGATCATGGTITVNTPLGAVIEYSIDGTTYQSSTSFTNVTPGIKTVYARYAGSGACTITKTDTVKAAICGTVYDDSNGLTDNTVNGAGSNAGSTLNAILYDNTTGKVAAVTTVAANGTYTLNGVTGDTYTIYITTGTASAGQVAVPVITLPSNWVVTGEKLGAGSGSDGTPDGILSIGTANANISNANFGIEQITSCQ